MSHKILFYLILFKYAASDDSSEFINKTSSFINQYESIKKIEWSAWFCFVPFLSMTHINTSLSNHQLNINHWLLLRNILTVWNNKWQFRKQKIIALINLIQEKKWHLSCYVKWVIYSEVSALKMTLIIHICNWRIQILSPLKTLFL